MIEVPQTTKTPKLGEVEVVTAYCQAEVSVTLEAFGFGYQRVAF